MKYNGINMLQKQYKRLQPFPKHDRKMLLSFNKGGPQGPLGPGPSYIFVTKMLLSFSKGGPSYILFENFTKDQ